jgi:hypothetical protein
MFYATIPALGVGGHGTAKALNFFLIFLSGGLLYV